MLNKFITNITHIPTRQILRRLLIFFYLVIIERKFNLEGQFIHLLHSTALISCAGNDLCHIPKVDTIDGLVDLLSLCNLVVLGNVLDFRTYSAPNQHEDAPIDDRQAELMDFHDQNNIPWDERMSYCYGRGVAITIMCFVKDRCLVVDGDGRELEFFPFCALVKQMKALLLYKQEAVDLDMEGAAHCTVELLEAQILNVVQWDGDIKYVFEGGRLGEKGEQVLPGYDLSITPPAGSTVHWLSEPGSGVEGW